MINLVTGKIGGGKTLYVVSQALEHVSKGGMIFSNIKFKFQDSDKYCRKVHSRFISPEQFVFHDFEKQPEFYESKDFRRGTDGLNTLVIVDESQIYYPASRPGDPRYKSILDFLTISRRFNVDVNFITQDPTTFYSGFRNQAQFNIFCTDMRQQTIGVFGKISLLGLRWSMKDARTDVLNTTGVTKISPLLFSCYDTKQDYSERTGELRRNTPVFQPVDTKRRKKSKK